MSLPVLSPQHPMGHGWAKGNPPLPGQPRGQAGARPGKGCGVRGGGSPAGLAPAPLLSTGNEATGWRFQHAAPGTVRHRTCTVLAQGVQPASTARPLHPAPSPRAKGCSGDPRPGDIPRPGDVTLPTWALRPWRGSCVPAWFTVHGPRDWLA